MEQAVRSSGLMRAVCAFPGQCMKEGAVVGFLTCDHVCIYGTVCHVIPGKWRIAWVRISDIEMPPFFDEDDLGFAVGGCMKVIENAEWGIAIRPWIGKEHKNATAA